MLFILHPGKQYPVSIISQINKPIQLITSISAIIDLFTSSRVIIIGEERVWWRLHC